MKRIVLAGLPAMQSGFIALMRETLALVTALLGGG
jgi:hypothetical protein